MKIKENFIMKTIAGENIAMAVGKEARNFPGMIRLNETGCFLWNLLEKGATMETLTEKLLEEYDTTKENAEKDISAFVETLKANGILEDE